MKYSFQSENVVQLLWNWNYIEIKLKNVTQLDSATDDWFRKGTNEEQQSINEQWRLEPKMNWHI